jgi:ElaB/YqjD/DUF883 family membrane-anchored ribosome-binding protein
MSKNEKKPLEAARERLTHVAEEAKDRYEKATADVQKKAHEASEELRRGAEVARKRYEEAEGQLRETYGRAQERARDWNRDLHEYVQEKPGQAVLIAAAVGFVIGLVLRRR